MIHVNTAGVVLQLVTDAEKSIAISHTVRMYSYLLICHKCTIIMRWGKMDAHNMPSFVVLCAFADCNTCYILRMDS